MRLNSNTLAYFANEIKAFRYDLLYNKGLEIEEEPELFSPFGYDDELRICALVYDAKKDKTLHAFRDYIITENEIKPCFDGIGLYN